ncbi:hypothetical protein GGS23DRAFT_436906 [Durotheca rogersii]|uniref:uncharacterized protein n=1 Tax=Durotheca rogersii TaxID=419775 RepID=UPI002220EBEB|nr:uncharacterized protein GGS23DRAFT_436906 [Durotheca rogersii]KAI5865649.1 hypothetical protein GGS23DRAFT_436906 [Durotheca rogersii]
MILNLTLLLLCLLFLQQGAEALRVTPGSPCADICLNNADGATPSPATSSTNSSDIVCDDQEYSTTARGAKFKSCVECLQGSNAVSGKDDDISWYLYNVRYAVGVCAYGFPGANKTTSSPCDIDYACRPLKTALETGNLNSSNGTQLDYCTADGGAFSSSLLGDCIQCFRSSATEYYLSNFLTALEAGCKQRPQPGELIGLQGTLFARLPIKVVEPPQNATGPASGDASRAGMTTGAIVGIAVGATLLLLGGTGLFFIYYRKQKRILGDPLGSQYDPRGGDARSKSITPTPPLLGGGGGGYHPQYQYTYEGRKDSLPSDWELQAKKPSSFSNNAEYYDMLEKAMASQPQPGASSHGGYAPVAAAHQYGAAYGPHSTLPTHPAYMPRVASRNGSSRNVTPSPPPAAKPNRPDTFALNAYLGASSGAAVAPAAAGAVAGTRDPYAPPQPPLPAAPHLVPPPAAALHPRGVPAAHSHSRMPAPSSTAVAAPPPPPPPPSQRAPRLSMPTVPKVRKPTKYAPPRIHVDAPTEPDAGPSLSPPPAHHQHSPAHRRGADGGDDADDVLSLGLNISMPAATRREPPPPGPRWEHESSAGYGSLPGSPPERQRQRQDEEWEREQQQRAAEGYAADRRRRMTEFTDISSVHSANSDGYGR